ncbi:hydroxyisourate hydrolase [Stutzerimonas kirkiae]|uniref:hydroxyisourate hydrolase n=1 Tax=Stutzerimonas kirkiae TaxID=2211392 RepID=UPI0010385CDC|nr:hydroxyisourate hydrolase [Stutzerimonas kirkiae]TBV13012.1 hydroxyisourate hydrolase [Stutzerimonas kirkiae]
MGKLTTHVLDAAHGCPGAGITLLLYRLEGDRRHLLKELQTNADGRCDQPLVDGEEAREGVYELHFRIGDYFRERGVELPEPAFLDTVVLRVGLSAERHFHVPLLVSPYSYSTYRGS